MEKKIVSRLIMLCLAALLGGGAAGADAPGCEAGAGHICGTRNAEDMVRLPGTAWVIASGLAGPGAPHGGLYAISADTRSVSPLDTQVPEKGTASGDCPGPPDPARFSAHGLSVRRAAARRFTLYVVGHGAREAIERFTISTAGPTPQLRWAGCIAMPSIDGAPAGANAVAALPGGAIAATMTPHVDHGDARAMAQRIDGNVRGRVMVWRPAGGWREVAGGRLLSVNGLVLAPDRRHLLVNAQAERAIYRLAIAGKGPGRIVARPDFLPDNIREGDDGMFYAAGASVSMREGFECAFSPARVCAQGYAVMRIDPVTLQSAEVLRGPGGPDFGVATTALRIGGSLWLSSYRGDRILIRPLPR